MQASLLGESAHYLPLVEKCERKRLGCKYRNKKKNQRGSNQVKFARQVYRPLLPVVLSPTKCEDYTKLGVEDFGLKN